MIYNIYCPIPSDISYIQENIADDITTISCKIGSIKIRYALLDSCSNTSVISDNLVKCLGLEINKDEIYRIKGYATYAETIGTVSEIPITIGDEKEFIT